MIGKTRLKRSLETHSEAEAERRKHAVVADFLAMIETAKAGALPEVAVKVLPARKTRSLTELALDLRESVQSQDVGTEARDLEEMGVYLIADEIRGTPVDTDEEHDEPIYDPVKETKAGEFVKVALGFATPIRLPLEKFHSEGLWNSRTKQDSERVVRYLEEWCETERISLTVEAVTRRVAGRFIGDLKASTARPLTNKTINKYLTCLSSYWSWLERRGYLKRGENPWKGQFLPKERAEEGQRERPFTDEEVKVLLGGKPNQGYVRSLMMIGALTGARIDAIVSLRARDITEEGFRFKRQKREAASRIVPIHSALQDVVAGLLKGKSPDDDLFPECPPVGAEKAQERSMPAVKAFSYYRQKVGVVDKVAGKRRDLVNFHSFRRWFITKAYQAGQPQIAIDLVVGHKPMSIAGSIYLGGLTNEQLRACVEAVQLPD
ncbi:MAG: tyrosine-type recombinase/integrase [Hyphomicrobiales bacterium]|nr:tyrosine-type recombinase/integrase [Hyphomicrobiales bacterium]